MSERLRAVLWPSSIAVEELPSGMVDYAMAKAAGEIFCSSLVRKNPSIKIYAPRLPRLRTDLTATPIGTNAQNAADVLLPILKEMQLQE